MIKGIKLTVEEADLLLKYLSAKPYAEVVQLIEMLLKAEKILDTIE